MKATSQEFKNLAKNPNGARYYVKILADGIKITDDIEDFVYSSAVNADAGISIGTACSSSVTFLITNPTVNLNGKELEVLQGINVGETIEYVKIGIFKVFKLTKNRNVTQYECVDRMTSRMEMPYFNNLSFPNTDITILKEICSQSGISLENASKLKPHTIKSAPKGYTKREVISYMAALQGKNAIINDEGNLELIWYTPADYIVDDDKIYYDGTSNINDETDYMLGYIECTVSNEEKTEQSTLKSGTGNTGIKIENPFMTQKILDEVFASIGNFFYRAGEFEFLGDFRLEAGDIVTVRTENSTYKVPIMQLTQKSDGGVVTTIQAVAESESENNIDLAGPVTKQMERYYADIVLINQAMINKLSADEADIRYLKTDQLTAIEANITEAVIGTVETKFITADYADLNYAKIDLTNIEKATIGTVLADVGLITNATIVDGHVTGYLDSVSINANSIKAGTISVDRLVLNGTNESLIFALNNSGELISTHTDTIDGGLITKRTITADHIVAGTITSNEIASETITSEKLNTAEIFSNSAIINKIFSNDITVTGTIISPILVSPNYKNKAGNFSESGMIVNLKENIIKSKSFSVIDGVLYATDGGELGKWKIENGGFKYNGQTETGYYSNISITPTDSETTDFISVTTHTPVTVYGFRIRGDGNLYCRDIESGSIKCGSINCVDINSIGEIHGETITTEKTSVDASGKATYRAIELTGALTPFVDFHYDSSTDDYTSRIIEDSKGVLTVNGTKFNKSDSTISGLSKSIKVIENTFKNFLVSASSYTVANHTITGIPQNFTPIYATLKNTTSTNAFSYLCYLLDKTHVRIGIRNISNSALTLNPIMQIICIRN